MRYIHTVEPTLLTFLWRSRDIPESFGRYPLDAIASCIGEPWSILVDFGS
ncbi:MULTISPECIES: hypothetical protein [unclassified Moorena]|nr:MULTISPECIES: hypothetical protein [unclassified Moorena]NEP31092.1 hypothetical protein [Moorena sp. SIO3B2]NEQ04943.1 hypothetical protein [Moorena sp. SIO4E2]NEQ12923.1 hypothetical protein [Moorena sp. SIO3E2]NER85939.1 hypothetical protein [Moorena sp. SIO3A2]